MSYTCAETWECETWLTQYSYNLKGFAINEEGKGTRSGWNSRLGSLRTNPLFPPITILVLVKNSLRTLQEYYELYNTRFNVPCCMAFHVFAGVVFDLNVVTLPPSFSTHTTIKRQCVWLMKSLSVFRYTTVAYCLSIVHMWRNST